MIDFYQSIATSREKGLCQQSAKMVNLQKSISSLISPSSSRRRSSSSSSSLLEKDFQVVNLSPVADDESRREKKIFHYYSNKPVPFLPTTPYNNCNSTVASSCSTDSSTLPEDEDDDDTILCPRIPIIPSKRHYEIIIVACGCFFNPQIRFKQMEGVKRCIAGYTGGLSTDETVSRNNLHDHSLALFIEYNPKKVSLQEILEMWKDNDDPWNEDEAEKWEERSAIFTTNYKQHEECKTFIKKLAKTRPYDHLHVHVERVGTNGRNNADSSTTPPFFYKAEEYLQDYLIKQSHAARRQIEAYRNGDVESGLFAIIE